MQKEVIDRYNIRIIGINPCSLSVGDLLPHGKFDFIFIETVEFYYPSNFQNALYNASNITYYGGS
jgi:hypothetical protein